jgi:hypothetical protein
MRHPRIVLVCPRNAQKAQFYTDRQIIGQTTRLLGLTSPAVITAGNVSLLLAFPKFAPIPFAAKMLIFNFWGADLQYPTCKAPVLPGHKCDLPPWSEAELPR